MSVTVSDIERACEILGAGGLVAIPTETVYGLAANAEDPAAIAKIFAAKERPASHPLIVHIASASDLHRWVADVPGSALLLAERFWPGPLTMVLPRGERVPLAATGGSETVAIRVPSHPITLELLQRFGGGLTAPSANRFMHVSPTSAADVRSELGDRVDFILDGGPCQVGVESTIVDLTSPAPAILRPGGITREQLQEALGAEVATPEVATVPVPGQHPSHYAPNARVVLVPASQVAATAQQAQADGRRVGVLLPAGSEAAAVHTVIEVPIDGREYAHNLYRYFRDFDAAGCDLIVASMPSFEGIGAAIANRLGRAAGPREG